MIANVHIKLNTSQYIDAVSWLDVSYKVDKISLFVTSSHKGIYLYIYYLYFPWTEATGPCRLDGITLDTRPLTVIGSSITW